MTAKAMTIKELRNAISQFNDEDEVVVEIHEGQRTEDLYDFSIESMENVRRTDGSVITEVRLCI